MQEGATKGSSISASSLKQKPNSLPKQIDALLSKNRNEVYKGLPTGSLAYLISENQLLSLRQSLNHSQQISKYHRQPINSLIVEDLQYSGYTYYDHNLKAQISEENQDPKMKIVPLTKKVYEQLARITLDIGWIKLERKVLKLKSQKQLQLYPFRINIELISLKIIRQASAQSQSSQKKLIETLKFPKIKVNFYYNETIEQMLGRIKIELFNQKTQLRAYAFDPSLFQQSSFARMVEYFYSKQNSRSSFNEDQIHFYKLQEKENQLNESHLLQFFPGKMLRNESVNEIKESKFQKLIIEVKDDEWVFPEQSELSVVKFCKFCMIKMHLYKDFSCQKCIQTYYFCSKVCHYQFLLDHQCPQSKDKVISQYGYEYLKRQVTLCQSQKTDNSEMNLDKQDVISYIKSDTYNMALVAKSNKNVLKNKNIATDSLGGGMNNLANTCYLNSSLQVLIRTSLTNTLLDMEDEIRANKKSKLTKAYLILIKKLKKLPVNESLSKEVMESFKFVIQECLPQFQGYEQHDAHQFIMFFLDKLSEQLNENENAPPLKLEPKRDSQPDERLARKQWLHLIQKNNSPIINLFYGQFKSEIDCPHCHTIYKTFDSFSVLSLSIPQKNKSVQIGVYYETNQFKEKIRQVKINNPGNTLDDLIKNTLKILRRPLQSSAIKAMLLGFEGPCQEIPGDKKISQLMSQINELGDKQNQLFLFQMPSTSCCMFLFKFLYEQAAFTFKKPLFILDAQTKIRNFKIYNTVSQYLINVASHYLSQDIKPEELRRRVSQQPLSYFKLRLIKEKGSKRSKQFIQIQPDPTIQTELLQKCEFEVRIQKFDYLSQKDAAFFNIILKKLNKFVKVAETLPKIKPESIQTPQILQDCLREEFNKKQLLANGNEWFCSTCNQKRRVHQITHVYKANKYLLIQIKRFKRGSDGQFYKNHSRVKLSLQLDLNQILVNPSLPQVYYKDMSDEELNTYHLPKITQINECSKYSLIGLVLHEGKIGSGHYITLFKDKEWLQYNDLRVSRINIQKELKQPKIMEKIYILLYQRIEK